MNSTSTQAETHAPELVSIVIPIFNERSVLPLLIEQVHAVLTSAQFAYELVLVDDGSRDDSWSYIAEQATHKNSIKAVKLSRNFGKEAALTAGLDQAKGDAIIIMDADLQDPPECIPAMLKEWQQGADVVCMKRRSRHGESIAKRLSAHVFYRLLNRISRHDIPTDIGDFRLISRRTLDALMQLPERNRYMKGLFSWVGFPTKVIEYSRPPRPQGESKQSPFSLLGLAAEGITSFSVAPLRWVSGLGLLTASMGILYGIWIIVEALLWGNKVDGYPSLIAIVTFIGGAQLLSIGIVGEYVGKIYMESKQRPLYIIQEIIEHNKTLSVEKRA